MDFFGTTVPSTVAFFLLGELAVLVTLVVAFVLARMHKGSVHHYLMLSAFLTDLMVFKPLMFSRASTIWGSFPWDGTRIAPHFLVAVSAGALGAFAVVLGFRYRIKKGPKMFMPPKGRFHRIVGRLFLIVWSVTFVVGLAIFIETYLP